MKKIKDTLILVCLASIALFAMSSCGDDEPYFNSPIVGNWELVEVDGIPVSEPDVCVFNFYRDRTGVFGQYNPYPYWSESMIEWELGYADGGAQYVYVYTGYGEPWSYLVRLYPTTLELTDLSTGQRLLFSEY